MALNQLKFDQLETGSVYQITASYAISSSAGSGGISLITGSTYPITSSWSNNSISSSFSVSSSYSSTSTSSSYSLNSSTASYLNPISQSLIPSIGSTYSLGSPTNKWKDLYVSTGSIYIGDTVLTTSGSTLYADVNPIVTLNTASGQIQVQGFTASLSASFSTNAGLFNNTASSVFATTGSNNFNGNQTVQGNVTVIGNLIAQQYIVSSSVSYFTSSFFDGSTKFGDTDSDTHQFTGSLRSPNITGSLLGTSSFSNNSTSASYSSTASVALNALTSSYINVATNAVSSSYSLTASFAENAGSSLTTGSTYPITSSWSNNSISSSFSNTSTSSSFASTASYNLNSVSSSYALTASFASNAGSSLTTGSTYPITSSWSNNSISSSYATNAGTAISATTATTATSATSASYATTAVNSTSASYALTSSYAANGGSGGTSLTTGSTYPITSSWANNVISASYAANGGGTTPVVSVASLNNQTILYNFSSSQEATITGLTLTNNNWGVNVIEEWNSGSGDIYFNSCSLLLHFSGSNNSTTFTDSSTNNFTVSVTGSAKITSSISKFGSGSGFFDGAGDSLTVPSTSNAAFNPISGFTVEGWVYFTSNPDFQFIISSVQGVGSFESYWFVGTSSGGNWRVSYGNASAVDTGVAIVFNTWTHFALSCTSTNAMLFVNGTQIGTATVTQQNVNMNLRIGAYAGGSLYYLNGYLDELRFTKGIARYTGSFVTQSVEFPNQLPQYETKYIGLVGGLNDTGSDYGIQKLDDTSLKIRKMSVSGTPVSGSPSLSASVDRVYVNVLNYTNVSVGSTLLGQTFTAVGSTSSYELSRSVVNPYEIVVAVDGAIQSFNDAYSVTSSTINFTETIPSGSLVDIRYLTTPNVNSASFATTSSYSLSGGTTDGTTSGKSIALSFILG